MLLAAAVALASAQEMCSWCEGGTCASECERVKAHLHTSITDETGKYYPYWLPKNSAVEALDSPSVFPDVEAAALFHHGDGRNGYDYLCSIYNSFVAEFGQDYANRKAVVFAPQLYYPEDGPEDSDLFWDRGATESSAWSWGFNSTGSLSASISSFQALDELLLAATNRTRFPSLRRVIVAGHSAGGQTVQRYALANRIHDLLLGRGLEVHYLPANPSSWTYLSRERPVLRANVSCGTLCDNVTVASTSYDFAEEPSGAAKGCKEYDTYGYGLDGVDVPYINNVGLARMLKAYPQRRVTYLAGASDICNKGEQEAMQCLSCSIDDGDLETTCSDYAQGWCRFERAHAFAQHIRRFYGGKAAHEILSVPGVGHNGCAMIQSTEVRKIIFKGLKPKEVVV